MAANPQFCSTCGAQLPGPVPTCARCGAPIAASARRSSAVTVVIVVLAVMFLGLPCLGIFAAIAIPNFVRYQLRAKAAEVKNEVIGLVHAEHGAGANGRYLALPRMPAAPTSKTKEALSPPELERAAKLGWMAPATSYGRYAVAVSEDGAAAAICGESDLDGDDRPAVFVAFLTDGSGAAPAAPCTEPVPYSAEFSAGTVSQVTGPNVF